MYVYFVCAWGLWRPEGGIRSLGPGVRDDCQPFECWKPNLHPLKEQQVLLIIEPSLSLPFTVFDWVMHLIK